jgi:hypothetical protein
VDWYGVALIRLLHHRPAPATDPGLASRALALDAALAADGATLPLRPTETALLRDWLHQLAR